MIRNRTDEQLERLVRLDEVGTYLGVLLALVVIGGSLAGLDLPFGLLALVLPVILAAWLIGRTAETELRGRLGYDDEPEPVDDEGESIEADPEWFDATEYVREQRAREGWNR